MSDEKQKLLMYQKKIQNDPNFYCKSVLGDIPWGIQIKIMEAIRDYPRVSVKSCHASGKGLKHGTPVLTPSGWVNIENISVGDMVIGGNGNPTKVNGVYPQGEKTIYRITLNDGSFVDTDSSHLWKIKGRRGRFGNQNYPYKYRDKIFNSDWEILSTLEIADLYSNGRPEGHEVIQLPEIPVCQFNKQNVPLDAYTLGVLLGDGSMTTNSISISTADEEILKLIKARTNFWKSSKYDYGVFDVLPILKQLGLFGKKSENKFVPDIYLWNTPEVRLSILQGLMDTDGGVSGVGLEFSSSSIRLANDVKFLVQSLGGYASIRKRKTKCLDNYRVYIRMDKLCPFKLTRKKNACEKLRIKATRIERRITKVEILKEKNYTTCISVEDKTSLFVTKDFIVTHNTWSAARIVLNFLYSYTNSIVLTTAPSFRQVEEVLWQEIHSAYNNSRCPEAMSGELFQTKLTISDGWFAVGLSTDDSNKFQGYHASSLMVLVDEASGLDKKIYDAIEGAISTGHVRFLLLGNPTDPTGYFADTFKSELWKKFTISCFDTPNFVTLTNIDKLKNSTPEERKKAVTHPYLITPQWAYERMFEWGVESPLFQARVLGQFPTEADDTLIALRYAEKALEREDANGNPRLREGDVWQIGLDVSRFGVDRTCFVVRHGNEVVDVVWYQKEDTMQVVGRAISFLRKYPEANMYIDEIGIGAGVVDKLKENDEFTDRVVGVNVSTKADETETMKFVNLRAKIYWKLRELFMNNKIILLDKGSMISDLTNIKYRFRSSDGALQIESKEEIKKRGLRSPDLSDSLALSFCELDAPEPNIIWI